MKIKITILALLLFVKISLCAAVPFNNVLLIINYNHAHYDSMALLEEMYKPYFANIVFYGPEEYPGVHQLSHYRGYFSYLCISDAMNRYPDFDGYFFLNIQMNLLNWLLFLVNIRPS